jgi:hypothetical protein
MASSYTSTDAAAYERLMGRWSSRLADELIAFAGIGAGNRAGGVRRRPVIPSRPGDQP